MTGNTQFEQALVEQQARDASHRLDKSKLLSVKKYLLNEESQYWSNGRFVCVTAYDPETRLVEFFYKEAFEPTTAMVPTHFIKVVGNKATMKEKPHYKVTVEQIGAYTMLVYRNAAGAPVHAYYSITRHQSEDYSWCMTLIPSMGIAYGPLFGLFALFVWFNFIVSFIIYGIEFLMAFNEMELRQKIEAMKEKSPSKSKNPS